MARSTSNLGAISDAQTQGKGKAPAQDFAGFHPLSEPTSTLNTELRQSQDESPTARDNPTSTTEDSQRYLEESRANLQPNTSTPIPTPAPRLHERQLSNASSIASSFADSAPGSFQAGSSFPSASGSGLDLGTTPQDSTSGTPAVGTPSHEPMLNFRSLAAVIGNEDKASSSENEHIENADLPSTAEEVKEPSPEGNRSRGDSGESSGSAPPPIYVDTPPPEVDEITPAPVVHHDVDKKDIERVDVWDTGHTHEATQ